MIIVPTIFFVFYRCVGSFFLKKTNMYRANWQRMRLIKHQVHCIPMDHHHQPPIARAHIEFCFPGSRGLLRHKQMALWFDSIESFRCCSSTETVASCLPPPPPPKTKLTSSANPALGFDPSSWRSIGPCDGRCHESRTAISLTLTKLRIRLVWPGSTRCNRLISFN